MASKQSGEKEESNLTKSAYMTLKDKIVRGELKQGEVISIAAMSRALNISRTPLANACQKLERDRLVTIIPKQGVVINSVSIVEAREVYELRAAVETYAAKKVFEYATADDIAMLEKSFQRQSEYVEKADPEKFMKEDLWFHKYLLSIRKNSQFLYVIDHVMDKSYLLGLESCRSKGRLIKSLEEHKAIIDALVVRDKDMFVSAVERNILNGLMNLTGDHL
ncbi:MAG TPA: GntR family transcriptional regulator [Rectinemataceae bacterium]|nr:GntR family transcriptional regulator [Rectinemataceae bacterium]